MLSELNHVFFVQNMTTNVEFGCQQNFKSTICRCVEDTSPPAEPFVFKQFNLEILLREVSPSVLLEILQPEPHVYEN